MNKFLLLILIIAIVLISGCTSYSPEVKAKIADCNKIIGWGECEMALAIEQNDASICGFIKNRYYKEVCKIAVTKSFEKCGDIKNWDFSEHKIESSDYNNMKKLAQKQAKAILTPTKSATIKTCYSLAAKIQNNIKVCDEIKDDLDKNSCKLQFPDQYNELGFCKSKQNKYEKDICFRDYAFLNKDIKFCSEISEFENQQYCKFEIIKRLNKTSSCAEISKSSIWYNTCLKEFKIQSDVLQQSAQTPQATSQPQSNIPANAPSSANSCTDSDNGKDYNVKGTGSGWNTDTEYTSFYDTCYKDYWANLVNTCSGQGCYLAEKYCDGKYARTELGISCPKGCTDGACVP